LGDMAEVGAASTAAHTEVGSYAASVGVEHLFAVGKMAPVVASAARAAGLDAAEVFNSVEELGRSLRGFLRAEDVVLLKASRSMALERVGELLRRAEPQEKRDSAGQASSCLDEA